MPNLAQHQLRKQEVAQHQATAPTADDDMRPNKPFGLSKDQIFQLKHSIVSSHEKFWNDWQYQLLNGADYPMTEVRKIFRDTVVKECREISTKRKCLLNTAKDMITKAPSYTRAEEDVVLEKLVGLLVANYIWIGESMAKKALYEFPPVYSSILDGIYNLFQTAELLAKGECSFSIASPGTYHPDEQSEKIWDRQHVCIGLTGSFSSNHYWICKSSTARW
jgi:hypothetical protein